ncbi:MAG: hypothetical protein ACXV5D_08400, partial [Halobacteriota archaeon]
RVEVQGYRKESHVSFLPIRGHNRARGINNTAPRRPLHPLFLLAVLDSDRGHNGTISAARG